MKIRHCAAVFCLCTLAACSRSESDAAPSGSQATGTESAGVSRPDVKTTPPPVPGAILSVAGRPILSSDLEDMAAAIKLAAPQYSLHYARRLALESVLIPRIALAVAHPKERSEAERQAVATLKKLQADPSLGTSLGAKVVAQDVRELGIPLWKAIESGARGRWLGPVEDLGRWRLARWLAASPAPSPGESTYTVEVIDFWYLQDHLPKSWIDAALSAATLEIHDEQAGEMVSERMRWRMKHR